MGVGIAEHRKDHASFGIYDLISRGCVRTLPGWPEILDQPIVKREERVLDGYDFAHGIPFFSPDTFRDDSDQLSDILDYLHLINSIDLLIKGCI